MMDENTTPVSVKKIAADWWFHSCSPGGPASHGGARAFRAACRRLRSSAEAYTLQETVAFHHAMQEAGFLKRDSDRHAERIGLIAALLGQIEHLRQEKNRPSTYAAVRMGKGNDRPPVSPLRFQRLIRSHAEELLTPLRRALGQIDSACDAGQLAGDLFYWGDDVKARWCLQYYGDTQSPTTHNTATEEIPA